MVIALAVRYIIKLVFCSIDLLNTYMYDIVMNYLDVRSILLEFVFVMT